MSTQATGTQLVFVFPPRHDHFLRTHEGGRRSADMMTSGIPVRSCELPSDVDSPQRDCWAGAGGRWSRSSSSARGPNITKPRTNRSRTTNTAPPPHIAAWMTRGFIVGSSGIHGSFTPQPRQCRASRATALAHTRQDTRSGPSSAMRHRVSPSSKQLLIVHGQFEEPMWRRGNILKISLHREVTVTLDTPTVKRYTRPNYARPSPRGGR